MKVVIEKYIDFKSQVKSQSCQFSGKHDSFDGFLIYLRCKYLLFVLKTFSVIWNTIIENTCQQNVSNPDYGKLNSKFIEKNYLLLHLNKMHMNSKYIWQFLLYVWYMYVILARKLVNVVELNYLYFLSKTLVSKYNYTIKCI